MSYETHFINWEIPFWERQQKTKYKRKKKKNLLILDCA